MQVRDQDTQVIYGLFQSICEWGLDRGYTDIAALKNLLKLAMVDVCRRRHSDKSDAEAEIAVVMDLGISIRNVQNSLRELDELGDLSGSFIKIQQVLREILMILDQQPRTLDELVDKVTHLIHAPYDLQKRAMQSILESLEQQNIIGREEGKETVLYRMLEDHISLFDPEDKSAKISGLGDHIEAYEHTIGEPYVDIFHADSVQAKRMQIDVNTFLAKTGTDYEEKCRVNQVIFKPFYYYLGSAPLNNQNVPGNLPDAMLRVLRLRFTDPRSASIARTHWYNLDPPGSGSVFDEVRAFIKKILELQKAEEAKRGADAYVIYFGRADLQ